MQFNNLKKINCSYINVYVGVNRIVNWTNRLLPTMKIIRSIENIRISCDYLRFSLRLLKKKLLPFKIILVFNSVYCEIITLNTLFR